jgi:acetyltransferase-like isoleucine patch superfamily enzyme
MVKIIRKFLKLISYHYYKFLIHIFYPQKGELVNLSPYIIKGYILPQKILNINGCRNIPWPVHFTSHVSGNLKVGRITTPGMMPGIYVNGVNGIFFGDNVYMGPGVKIMSANHNPTDYKKHLKSDPIRIGNNVWIGADAIILPGVTIGDDVIIGAGSIVTNDIQSNCIVAGNPARFIKDKVPHKTIEQGHDNNNP